MKKAEICFIKNGDIISEYKKLRSIWKNNSAKLIWDMKEISKKYKTLVISEMRFIRSDISCNFSSLKDENIHLYCINKGKEPSFLIKIKNLLYYQIKVLYLLNKYKPSYIICSNMRTLFFFLFYSKINGIKFIPNFARADHLSKANINLLKLFSIKNIIVPGKHMRKILRNKGINSNIYVRIPKYPEEFFTERYLDDFPEFDFKVIFVARIEKLKGVFELIEAAFKILSRYKNIGFVFLGDGSDFDKLYNMVKDSGYEDNIKLLGWKEHLLIGSYLKISDVVVLPSYTEGFTRTWLEGIYTETPIITTPLEGIKEYLEDGKTGIFVRKKNIEDIVDAILKIYKNPELRKSIKNNLRDLKKEILNGQELSFKDCVEKIIQKKL